MNINVIQLINHVIKVNPVQSTNYKLSRPPPHKLFQIPPRRNPQHKLPQRIRDNRKPLLLPALPIPPNLILEKLLQLLQRRLHRDNPVRAAFAMEALHRRGDGICFVHGAFVEALFEEGDVEVAEEGAGGGDDREVGVVPFVGG